MYVMYVYMFVYLYVFYYSLIVWKIKYLCIVVNNFMVYLINKNNIVLFRNIIKGYYFNKLCDNYKSIYNMVFLIV